MTLFKDLSVKTQQKWQELTDLTMDECLREQSAKLHGRIWKRAEVAHRANISNEREEVFLSYKDGRRIPRVFKPTRSFMRKMLYASMTNGSNSVWDLEYTAPRFGECGYIIRINEKVPYGFIRHLTVIPAGCAKTCFEVIFNLGDKLDNIDVAAKELAVVPTIDPYLTILLAMYHLKRGDHDFAQDTANELRATLRLLEMQLADYRDNDSYLDLVNDLALLGPPGLSKI